MSTSRYVLPASDYHVGSVFVDYWDGDKVPVFQDLKCALCGGKMGKVAVPLRNECGSIEGHWEGYVYRSEKGMFPVCDKCLCKSGVSDEVVRLVHADVGFQEQLRMDVVEAKRRVALQRNRNRQNPCWLFSLRWIAGCR